MFVSGNLDPMGPEDNNLLPPHGGYADLAAYKMAELVFDGTCAFTGLYLDRKSRTVDQMVQAARSGKQNIAEGSVASGTSKKIELKLIGIARASLAELLEDYRDFLRLSGEEPWTKDHEKAIFIRRLAYRTNRSYKTYQSYIETKGPINASNTMICLIHQTNYLLDKLIKRLESDFLENGGFTERLYTARKHARAKTDEKPS